MDTKDMPLHAQAANYMRDKIYSHEWMIDEKIPSEHELCEELGMSRGTIRRAIKTLVDEGLLDQQHGRGTLVTRTVLTHPTGSLLMSYAESLASQGIEFVTKVLRQEVVSADRFLSGKLLVPMGTPVLLLDRVRVVGGSPVMLIESVLNIKALPGLEDVDYTVSALFATIEAKFGKLIGHSTAQYAAGVVGSERGKILEVAENSPVLHVEQQVFLTDNTLSEYSNVWLSANKYLLGTIMQRV